MPHQDPSLFPKQSFSTKDSLAIQSEISHLLKIEAVRSCSSENGQFISSIFLVPKSNGGQRFILNLKNLNKYVLANHFKMEDSRTAVSLMTQSCFMLNLDLKEAYFLVPISDGHRKYLRFYFNNILYEFCALPFGLCSAPYIFTKLLKPVMSHLRSRGYKSVYYLDDILCLGNTYQDCLENAQETIACLTKLGFIINYKKSSLTPSQTCQFLGFILNSKKMQLELPTKKRQGIFEQTIQIKNVDKIRIRDLARYAGTLTAACPAVSYGWAHTKAIERAKYLALLDSKNYDCRMKVPTNLYEDLAWWEKNIMYTHNPIRTYMYILEIFTDASTTGWGAACGTEKIGGFWSPDEQSQHINYLELLAAYFGLKSFAERYANCEILMRIDNTTAISYINRMGGVQYPHLNTIARNIWQWCEERKIFIFASYVKSAENVDADSESRKLNIDTEWELSTQAYKTTVETFGLPKIDLFASRVNAKCDKYISWKRDPYAFNVDAFTVKWDDFFYAFPPFSLIMKTLQKIITDKATGILIVPNWVSQPWYPVFKSLAVNKIIIFPPSKDLLTSVFREVHPLHRKLSLVASVLSGKRS